MNLVCAVLPRVLFYLGIGLLAVPACGGETVYRCVSGGKVSFTSDPSQVPKGNCHTHELKIIQPNPQDVAEQMAKKEADAKAGQLAAERSRREKEIIDAAVKRQAKIDEMLRLQKTRGVGNPPAP